MSRTMTRIASIATRHWQYLLAFNFFLLIRNHPAIVQCLIQQLVLAESEANAKHKEAEQLQGRIEQLKQTLESIPANKTSLQELQKEKDVAEGVYQGMVAKLQQAKIDAFNVYPQVQVL